MTAEDGFAQAQEQLAEAKKQLQALEQRVSKLMDNPVREAAELLHSFMCHANHIDGCGWEYESWEEPGRTRYRYATKATAVLREIDLTTLQRVIRAMRTK